MGYQVIEIPLLWLGRTFAKQAARWVHLFCHESKAALIDPFSIYIISATRTKKDNPVKSSRLSLFYMSFGSELSSPYTKQVCRSWCFFSWRRTSRTVLLNTTIKPFYTFFVRLFNWKIIWTNTSLHCRTEESKVTVRASTSWEEIPGHCEPSLCASSGGRPGWSWTRTCRKRTSWACGSSGCDFGSHPTKERPSRLLWKIKAIRPSIPWNTLPKSENCVN